jgi:hypothetical protein
MSTSLYASLPTGHFMSSSQDLSGNSQYARHCTGHLAGCTQDFSGNLLYANPDYLYARASAGELSGCSQDFMNTSPYAREVSRRTHRLLNFILLPAFPLFSSVTIRGCLPPPPFFSSAVTLLIVFIVVDFSSFVFIRPIHVILSPLLIVPIVLIVVALIFFPPAGGRAALSPAPPGVLFVRQFLQMETPIPYRKIRLPALYSQNLYLHLMI